MSFTAHMRRAAKPIWDAQLAHPFVVALGNGTLPKRKFRYYILQDARYLEELARVFALGAQKAADPDTALRFAKLVEETIVVERGLHETFGRQWNIAPADMRRTPLAPTNHAYCTHMRSVAQAGTVAELTTVALPCAWIYGVVGKHLLRHPPAAGHPYREWLLLYGSPEFAEVTRWMRTVVDTEATRAGRDEKARMMRAFLTSSRYEWMFWDMAWREERWPV